MDNSPFFIIGSQRSGTTLLRLILNSHSEVAIPEEADFLMPLMKKKYLHRMISGDSLKALVKYLRLSPQFKLWAYDYEDFFSELSKREEISLKELISSIFSTYCLAEGKKYWGDKTPSFFRKIDIMHALFPNAKCIHIVRDGRDVFDSLRKAFPSLDHVSVAAIEWSYKLLKIERSLKKININNCLTIRYEDLIEDPESTVKKVCVFIGIKYEQTMIEFYKTSHKYIGDHHSELIFKSINKSNKCKWKKNLNSEELAIYNFLAKFYLTKYEYEYENIKINIMYMLKSMLIGFPVRVFEIINRKRSYEVAVKKGLVATQTVGKSPKNYKSTK